MSFSKTGMGLEKSSEPSAPSFECTKMASGDLAPEQFSVRAEAGFRAYLTVQTMADVYMELYGKTRRAVRTKGKRG